MAMHKVPGNLARTPAHNEKMKPMSSPQNTSTGSSSRPDGKGRFPIKSSAPDHPHHLDGRHVPGALK
jgi:hypothetical protein